MALIYKATLTPSKIELLTAWLPDRPWAVAAAGTAEFKPLGAYRFDDPAGQVGIESILVATGGPAVLHVPLTYRAEPLAGAEEFLVGTTEHSVLGRRWVYDGTADPVWASALLSTVLTGGTQVEELVEQGDGRREPRPPTATVTGSGTPGTPVPAIGAVTSRDEGLTTVVRAGELELVVARVVGAELPKEHTLTGKWATGGPAVLAGVRSA